MISKTSLQYNNSLESIILNNSNFIAALNHKVTMSFDHIHIHENR